MSKNIIITGGAGFIGYHLSKKLAKKGFIVNIIDNLSRGKYDREFKELIRNKKINFFKKDLQKKINLNIKNPKLIFHLAGSVGVENINKDSYHAFINNIISLKNILDFSKKNKSTKLILFSTSEVYSPLIKNNKINFPIKELNNIILENDIIDRDSYYISKAFNEKLVQFSKINHLILRPHNIYGPRMGYSHVIPELIKRIHSQRIKKTFKTEIYSPKHTRSFCYIDDAINQIINLSLNNKINRSIFNIGNMNEEIKIFKLAEILREKIYPNAKLFKGSVTLGSPKRRVPDMKKTQRFVKSNKNILLKDGLNQTINWYLKDLKK